MAVWVEFKGLPKIPLIVDALLAPVAPVKPPVTTGVPQLYNVPDGTIPLLIFVGLTVNATPLQLTELIAVITAVGLIVTVNVNVDPIQVPVIGVTVYVAVLAIFVVFVKPPLILATATPCEAPPVNPVPVGAVHVYKVPTGTTPSNTSVGLILNTNPLHTVVVIALMIPTGLIVTVTVKEAFAPQLSVVGVTIYTAVCALLVGLAKVPLINDAPDPLVPPVKPPLTLGALQAYVVPAGTIPLVRFVGLTVKATPLQLTELIAVITAVGFNVTVTVNTAPIQVPVIGVTE